MPVLNTPKGPQKQSQDNPKPSTSKNQSEQEETLIDLDKSSNTISTESKIPVSVKKFGIPLPGMTKTRSDNKSQRDHNASNSFNIRKFDGNNFGVWKAQVMAVLTVKECDIVVMVDRPSTVDDTWDSNNNLAKAIILLSLSDDQAALVCHLDTAKEIWDRLLQAHQQHSDANKVVMQRQFFDSVMNEGESAMEFVARVQAIFNNLNQAGVKMTEETLVGRIVAGLTQRYHVFMTNWANSKLKQTMAELVPRLTAEEALIGRFAKTAKDSVALVSESKARFSRDKTQRPNFSKTGQEQGPNRKRDKSKIMCFICRQKGHYRTECQNKGNSFVKPTKKFDGSSRNGELVLVEGLIAEMNLATESSEWIMDSGATDHMSHDKQDFSGITFFESPKIVKLGDLGTLKAVGVGSVELVANMGTQSRRITLNKVLYVPGMRRKLISIGAATTNCCSGEISAGRITLKNSEGLPILIGEKVGNLYKVKVERANRESDEVRSGLKPEAWDVEEVEETENSDKVKDSNLKLWHERMAHISRNTIVKMQKKGSAFGLERVDLRTNPKESDRRVINCDSCLLSKHSRIPIPMSTRPRATIVGERLHLDICGPVGAETLAGSKYFLLFKDEFSNFRFIYFMKSREEAYGHLKHCVAKIMSETGKTVRAIVSDCGSEFTSKRTQAFLEEKNIIHEKSVPFCPQQNGFIERDNRTIMEACRAMLFHRNLPESLWAEACNVAVYVLNRVINVNTGDQTPYELYYGRKPRLNHLRVFGSVCFMKVQEKKRSGYQRKIEARSKKLILVGYARDYTYRVYDPERKEIYLSREVVFDENASYDTSEERPVEYEKLDTVIGELERAEGDNVDYEPSENDETIINEEVNISALVDDKIPVSYEAAIESPEAEKWRDAIAEEESDLGCPTVTSRKESDWQ